jgi:hypothetical protein
MERVLPSEAVPAGAVMVAAKWWNPASWLMEKQLSRGFWIFFSVAFFFDFGFAVYFFLFNLYLVDLHFNEAHRPGRRRVHIGYGGGNLACRLDCAANRAAPFDDLLPRPGAVTAGRARTLATTEMAQIGLAFLAGIAMSIWGVCFLPAIAGLTTPENRSSAFSLIFSVSIGTSALGGLVCGYLPDWLRMAGHAMQDRLRPNAGF